MNLCSECGQSGTGYAIPGLCLACMHRLESELAYLESVAKDVATLVPWSELFCAGGIGHRLELLRAKAYSWLTPDQRERWLKEREL